MSGSNTRNQPGVYGTKGVPAAGNVPGSRDSAVSWTDASGNLWFFGGLGFDANGQRGDLNDLWKYDPTPTTLTPSLITPAPGSVLSGSAATFTWSNPGGFSTRFVLRLGTTGLGSSNVFSGGANTGTSEQVSAIPADGAYLYARLWYYLYGKWQFADARYTEAGKYTPPALTTPAPGSTLPGSTATFAWSNPGNLVPRFVLRLGTTGFGTVDVLSGAANTGTSQQVSAIPTDGAYLYARLWYYVNGAWQYVDATYTEAGAPTPPAFTTPAPGSTLPGSTVTFGWDPGGGATRFVLRLGTTGLRSSDVYNGASTTGTSVQVTTVPTNGAMLYARLWYYLNGIWQYVDATYGEASQ